MNRAIDLQFKRVLERQPTQSERERFLKLFEKTVKPAESRACATRWRLCISCPMPSSATNWAETGADGRARLRPENR